MIDAKTARSTLTRHQSQLPADPVSTVRLESFVSGAPGDLRAAAEATSSKWGMFLVRGKDNPDRMCPAERGSSGVLLVSRLLTVVSRIRTQSGP